jgi:hypothetical protein
MIKFPCKCGHRFELPDDQAGGLVQCPECFLLADVPSMNDVGSLHEDGTFAFGSPTHVVDTTTVADRARIFSNKTVDEFGNEKDLRSSVDQLRLVGDDEPVRVAPRYDPETGELIRAIPLKDEKPAAVILLDEHDEPVAAPRPVVPIPPPPMTPVLGGVRRLTYAADDDTRGETAMSLLVKLFQPANTAVLIFLYFGTLIGRAVLAVLSTYTEGLLHTVWPFLIVDLPMWLIVSHLGIVVETTGPDGLDELPRPLGNFEIGQDILTPLWRTCLAGLICFLPTVLIVNVFSFDEPAAWFIAIAAYVIGCCAFPGVLVTAIAGTTVLNLRPDRVLDVIVQSGPSYLISAGLSFLTVTLGTFYLAGEMLFPGELDKLPVGYFKNPFFVMGLSAVFVIVMHWFGWHLGLIYRRHHQDYPWLAQRHVRKPRPTVKVVEQ